MSERQKILSRIRAALSVPAPRPGSHGSDHPSPSKRNPGRTVQRWLPTGGESFAEHVEHFRARSAELKTDFRLFNTSAEVEATLAKIAIDEKWQRIATHDDLARITLPALPMLTTSRGYDVNELETCDAGITACDALIAQTGSIIVTSRDSGGRALSVLPPHHVVLARRDQLVRDLSVGLERVQKKYAPKYPSMISIVTGPSRTGDIERILVLGAHGPKKLTVLCW